MVKFRSLVFAFVLAGLFAFALINFGIKMQDQYGSTGILDDPLMGSTVGNLSEDLSALQSQAESQKTSFFQDIPLIGDFSIVLGTIVFVGRAMVEITRGVGEIIIAMVSVVFGIGSDDAKIIVGVVTAMLIFSLVLLSWKLYRAGE